MRATRIAVPHECHLNALEESQIIPLPGAHREMPRDQDLLCALMDSLPDTVYFKDTSSRFVRINRALAKRFGLEEASQAVGKTDFDFFSPEHASATQADEHRIIETGNPLIGKEELETWPDGRTSWVATTKMALRGPAGDIIGTFGVSKDITARKLAQDALRASEHQHRRQSSLLDAIYDAAPDGILVVDQNGTILSHNRQFLEIWQLERAERIGHHGDSTLAAVMARVKDPDGFRRHVEKLYRDPSADDHCEIELKDGRTVERVSTAVRGADGEYLGRVWFFHDISRRKQMQEVNEMLAAIVQSSEDAIFSNVDGIIVSWNRGAELLFGYREDEAKGRHVSTLVPPERQYELARIRQKVDGGEAVSSLETVRLRKDGSRVNVSLSVSPIRNAAGAVVGHAAIAIDITARKQAEKQMLEQARVDALRLEVSTALTRGGPLRTGLQGCAEALVRWTGVAFARIWTLEPDAHELVLEASAGIYTRVDGGHARVPLGKFKIGLIAQDRQVKVSGDVQNDPEVSDHEWARREGMVSFVGCPLVVEGKVVGVAAGFSRQPLTENTSMAFSSIADQAAQFIHGKRAEEALRRSEERARLLFAAIPHPAYVLDLETLDFLEVNDCMIERYGYSRSELLGMKITDIRSPEDANRLREYLRSEYAGQTEAGQWRHCTKDGRTIDVQVGSHAIDYGGRKAAFNTAQDITVRKKLEMELRQAQKLEAVGRLASGIAHEINTPVQFVGDNLRFLQDAFGSLDGLLKKHQCLADACTTGEAAPAMVEEVRHAAEEADLEYLTEEVPKAVSQSLDGVARVATIVKAMKEFAHPEQNQKAAADLNQALASTLVVARNELKYVADVETDFGDLPPVECHLGDLNQVFLNLLVNSAHAIAEVVHGTGEKGTIRVQTRQEDGWIRIAISDTGCGIPEHIRDKIFDPFFTTKGVGQGTGQGLAISRSIVVDKHGGTLTFVSEVGRGTTFSIGLPLSSQ